VSTFGLWEAIPTRYSISKHYSILTHTSQLRIWHMLVNSPVSIPPEWNSHPNTSFHQPAYYEWKRGIRKETIIIFLGFYHTICLERLGKPRKLCPKNPSSCPITMTEYLVFVLKGVDCCGSRASRHSRVRTHGSEPATLGNRRSHSAHSNCLISSYNIFYIQNTKLP